VSTAKSPTRSGVAGIAGVGMAPGSRSFMILEVMLETVVDRFRAPAALGAVDGLRDMVEA